MAQVRSTRLSRSLFTLFDRLFDLRRSVGDSKSTRLEMLSLEERVVPDSRPLPFPVIHLGAGAGVGSQPIVKAYNAETGELMFEKLVFEANFTGGVHVTTADISRDGIPDLIVAPGKGGGPRIRVLDGLTGESLPSPIGDFFGFETTFTGGVNLAAADVDGDTIPDIIAAAGQGGGPRVRIFSGKDASVIDDFFAFAPEFKGGATVAAADFTGDGRAEIVIGAGIGGGPHVITYNVTTHAPIAGALGSFFAFDAEERGGVNVGTDSLAGDINGDKQADLVVGRGVGFAPMVKAFSGADGKLISEFMAYSKDMTAGVRTGTAFVDNDRFADIVTSSGPGVEGRIRTFSGTTGQPVGGTVGDFVPVEGLTSGWSVGASNDPPASVWMQEDSGTDGAEGGPNPTISFYREGGTIADPLTIDITIDGGDAVAWVDFTPIFAATFAPGETKSTIEIPIIDDTIYEPDIKSIIYKIREGLDYIRDSRKETVPAVTIHISGDSDPDSPSPSPPAPPSIITTPMNLAPPDCDILVPIFQHMARENNRDIDPGFTVPVPPPPPGFIGDPGFSKNAENIDKLTGGKDIDPGFSPKPQEPNLWGVKPSDCGVDWATGELTLATNDCAECLGLPDQLDRYLSSNADSIAGADNFTGKGSALGLFPTLHLLDNGNKALIISNGSTARYFDYNSSTGKFDSGFYEHNTLEYDTTNDDFILHQEDGSQVVFDGFDSGLLPFQKGQLKKAFDRGGNLIEVIARDSEGRPTAVKFDRPGGGAMQYLFDYYPANNNSNGLMSRATLQQSADGSSFETVRMVDYVYYAPNDANGPSGYLKLVETKDVNNVSLGVKYYRYYTEDGEHSFSGALRYAFGADSMHRIVAAGLNPYTATDSELAPYADNYIEWDKGTFRVTKHVVQGTGCSVCSAGLGGYEYAYLESNNSIGFNSWRMRTTETLPDDSQNIVFTNGYGQVMLFVQTGPGGTSPRATHYLYDSAGRVTRVVAPSAVINYNESFADLINQSSGYSDYIADQNGLVVNYGYNSAGLGTTISIQDGDKPSVSPQLQVTLAYVDHTLASGITLHNVSSVTTYAGTNGSGAATTTLEYYWASTAQPSKMVVTLPAVATAQNGSNTSAQVAISYDSLGRVTWMRDADHVLTAYGYESRTGEASFVIEDVNTALFSTDLPDSSWATTSGQHLQTSFDRDLRGRVTKMTYADGSADYTIFNDANRETRTYTGWNASTHTATTPTEVSRWSSDRKYYETFTTLATPTIGSSDDPTGQEQIETVLSLSRTHYSNAGQAIASDDYFNLDGFEYSANATIGAAGTNYLHTEQAYTHRGLPSRTLSPSGWITRTVYDDFARPVSVWEGTDDEPDTGWWSPGNTLGTDLVKIAEYQYDGGGAGNGNMTQVTEFTGSASRVNKLGYDWRNRLVAVKHGHQSSTESLTLNRPLLWLEYDNRDRVTATAVYDGDRQAVAAANPSKPADSLRRSRSVVSYDALGQVWRTDEYGVNQSTGALTTTPSTTQMWYDLRGLPIKVQSPSGLVEKTAYDLIGRPTITSLTDGGGDTGWTNAVDVLGDTVWQQMEYAYDPVSQVTGIVTRDRFHNQSGTGALEGPTSTNNLKARVSYLGFDYDDAGRTTDAFDYGTDLLNTPIHTTYFFDDANRAVVITDPNGNQSRSAWDILGRTAAVTAAYNSGIDLTTSYGYDSTGRLTAVTEPGNRTTGYSYDEPGRSMTVSTPASASTIYYFNQLGEFTNSFAQQPTDYLYGGQSYDVVGRVISSGVYSINELSRFTNTTSDALGRPLTVTNPRGYATSYAYDDVARKVNVMDALSKTSTASYDAAGRLVSITDPLNHSTTTSYDLLDRTTSITDALNHSTSFQYWVDGSEDRVLAPLSRTTRVAYDTYGRPETAYDALNHATTLTYDPGSRVTKATDAKGIDTAFTYNALGQTLAVTEAANSSLTRTTSYGYKAATGELETVTDPLGRETTIGYDAYGRPTSVTAAANKAEAFTLSTTYDAWDRPTRVTRPGSRTVDYVYNAYNEVRQLIENKGQSLERTTKFTYDANGNQLTTTDPLNHTTTTEYDALDRAWRMTDALNGKTTLSFDDAGRLVSLTDPVNNVTSWGYDAANRKTSETDPFSKVKNYTYDDANRLSKITDRLGRERVFGYDAADRLTSETWNAKGGSFLQQHLFTYDANDNLLTATDPDGNYTITYDDLNRADTVVAPFGINFDFGYDAVGNRTSVIDNKGGITASKFDNLNRLVERSVEINGTNSIKAEWGFDSKGDQTTSTKSAWVSGAWSTVGQSTFTFDDLGRETGIIHQNSDKTVTFGDYQYLFDAADRVTQMTIDGVTTKYDYDNTNQLAKDGSTSFTYDANGNRTMTGYSTGASNRTTSDGTWTYAYDDEGNVTSKASSSGTWNYEYDFHNQMTKASFTPAGGSTVTKSVENKFDAFGNRLERDATENGTTTVERYVYDGWDTAHPQAIGSENFDAVMDLNGNNVVAVRRTFGAAFDELVAREDGNGGSTKWYGIDKLGSVRFVSDDSGTKSNAAEYNAWGDILSGTLVDRYGFQGREHDAITGLRHHRARETNGQFWFSEDPMGFAAGDVNLHRIVGNSPNNSKDPSGHILIVDRKSDFANFEAFFKANGIDYKWYADDRGFFVWINPNDRQKLINALQAAGWGQGIIDMIINCAIDYRDTYDVAFGGNPTGQLFHDQKSWGTRVARRHFAQWDKELPTVAPHSTLEDLNHEIKKIAKSDAAKEEADRIAKAIQNTFKHNGLADNPLSQTKKGYFCYEWVYAFEDAFKLISSGKYFKAYVEGGRKQDGSFKTHFWLVIESLETGEKIYIDDGFMYEGMYVHGKRVEGKSYPYREGTPELQPRDGCDIPRARDDKYAPEDSNNIPPYVYF